MERNLWLKIEKWVEIRLSLSGTYLMVCGEGNLGQAGAYLMVCGEGKLEQAGAQLFSKA